ncbi:hypothetical protein BpHYR1_033243 [Brachionus plicatilis]|uniref:Uncharacterized protein n=1 Tax=Brachionus plicatilis TaxID=10195 RepID=A0A3M7PF80_BRAPC|nr:hypothetical protein BpHYR1_033243 [Brachionus plicatilis]
MVKMLGSYCGRLYSNINTREQDNKKYMHSNQSCLKVTSLKSSPSPDFKFFWTRFKNGFVIFQYKSELFKELLIKTLKF